MGQKTVLYDYLALQNPTVQVAIEKVQQALSNGKDPNTDSATKSYLKQIPTGLIQDLYQTVSLNPYDKSSANNLPKDPTNKDVLNKVFGSNTNYGNYAYNVFGTAVQNLSLSATKYQPKDANELYKPFQKALASVYGNDTPDYSKLSTFLGTNTTDRPISGIQPNALSNPTLNTVYNERLTTLAKGGTGYDPNAAYGTGYSDNLIHQYNYAAEQAIKEADLKKQYEWGLPKGTTTIQALAPGQSIGMSAEEAKARGFENIGGTMLQVRPFITPNGVGASYTTDKMINGEITAQTFLATPQPTPYVSGVTVGANKDGTGLAVTTDKSTTSGPTGVSSYTPVLNFNQAVNPVPILTMPSSVTMTMPDKTAPLTGLNAKLAQNAGAPNYGVVSPGEIIDISSSILPSIKQIGISNTSLGTFDNLSALTGNPILNPDLISGIAFSQTPQDIQKAISSVASQAKPLTTPAIPVLTPEEKTAANKTAVDKAASDAAELAAQKAAADKIASDQAAKLKAQQDVLAAQKAANEKTAADQAAALAAQQQKGTVEIAGMTSNVDALKALLAGNTAARNAQLEAQKRAQASAQQIGANQLSASQQQQQAIASNRASEEAAQQVIPSQNVLQGKADEAARQASIVSQYAGAGATGASGAKSVISKAAGTPIASAAAPSSPSNLGTSTTPTAPTAPVPREPSNQPTTAQANSQTTIFGLPSISNLVFGGT